MSVQSIRRTALPLWVAAVAVLLLAANLRVAVNAVGATLPEMRTTLGMSGAAAGLLTALPPFCFGLMGLAGPALARRIGLERTALLSALVLTAGQLVRAAVPGQVWVLAGSSVALAAIALANVVMPSLIRKLFPQRMAAMTTAYTAIMTLFAALTSFVTLPIQAAFGADYRLGLGMWAILSLLAVLPWLSAIRSHPFAAEPGATPADGVETAPTPARRIRLAELARVPKAWILAALFGTQSLQAYIVFGWLTTLLHDEGLSTEAASAQVGVVSLAATVATLFAPTMIGRMRRPATLTWVSPRRTPAAISDCSSPRRRSPCCGRRSSGSVRRSSRSRCIWSTCAPRPTRACSRCRHSCSASATRTPGRHCLSSAPSTARRRAGRASSSSCSRYA